MNRAITNRTQAPAAAQSAAAAQAPAAPPSDRFAAALQRTCDLLVTTPLRPQEGDSEFRKLINRQQIGANNCIEYHDQAGETTGGRFPPREAGQPPVCPGAPMKKRKFGDAIESAKAELPVKYRAVGALYASMRRAHDELWHIQKLLTCCRWATDADIDRFTRVVSLFREFCVIINVAGELTKARVVVGELYGLASNGGIAYYPLLPLYEEFNRACAPIKSPFH